VVSPDEFITIETVLPDGAGVGDDGDDDPQPNETPRIRAVKRSRIRKIPSSWPSASANGLPVAGLRDLLGKRAIPGQSGTRSGYEE
jgi:hypothetical protein